MSTVHIKTQERDVFIRCILFSVWIVKSIKKSKEERATTGMMNKMQSFFHIVPASASLSNIKSRCNCSYNSLHNKIPIGFQLQRREQVRHTSEGKRPISPYVILKLKTSATEFDIKQAFRKLAKKYHPDLNPNIPTATSQRKMAEIIQAYEQLLDDDFLGVKVGDGRVALACEMFTIDELRMDKLHDVYPIRIIFEESKEHRDSSSSQREDSFSQEDSMNLLSEDYHFKMICHPEDSVSDLKRMIQGQYEEEWELLGRRMDRDKIRTGWELICLNQRNMHKSDRKSRTDNIIVMSYHLFVQSYKIQHGDIIYAVVRKYDS